MGVPSHPYVGDAKSQQEGLSICANGTTLQGADVSSYQASVDWATAATQGGLSFAIAKATEGLTVKDSEFAANWSGMRANGLVRGAYHFFHSQDDGAAQADQYLLTVGTFEPGDLPPFLDWEATDSGDSNALAIQRAQAFIDEIKAKTGLTTVIYTYPSFWAGLGDTSQFASYPVWYANYSTPCPNIPSPWTGWAFWQYSATGTVPGLNCPGACDVDEFNGTLEDLQAFAVGGDGGISLTPGDGGSSSSAVLSQVSGNDAVTLVNWPDQHMEIFAITPSGTAMHAGSTGTTDTWSALASLDTGAECGSAAAFWGGQWVYPELFSPLSAGGTGHLWWTAGSGWNTYHVFDGTGLSHLSTLVWPDGHTEVFALGSDGTTWHNYWNQTVSNWSGWASIGGTSFTEGPTGIIWADGHGEIYEVDASGGVWQSKSPAGAGTDWSAFAQLGTGMASRLSPVRWPDGTVEIFARATDGTIWRDTAGGATFGGFSQLNTAPTLGAPSAYMNPAGQAEVVTRDPSGQVIDVAYTVSSGSWPSTFTSLGQVASSEPFGWIRGDGRAEVFAVDASGNLQHALRSSTGTFASWATLGSGVSPCDGAVIPPVDAGAPADAGPPADGGAPVDAGTSMMHLPVDAGPPMDAGGSTGGTRSGSTGGASSGSTGGTTAGGAPKNGCGCDAGGTESGLLALLLTTLGARRRRRQA